MEDQGILGFVTSADGKRVIGRVDYEHTPHVADYYDTPQDYTDATGGTVRVVGAGYSVRHDYYESTAEGAEAAALASAWERFTEEFGEREAAEVMERYLHIFHPFTAFTVGRVLTGYSQGDEVTLAAWMTLGEARATFNDKKPDYKLAAWAHEALEQKFELIGAIARGQFWELTLQEVSGFELEGDDTCCDVRLEFGGEVDSTVTLCMEEFDPRKELAELAEWSFVGEGETFTTL